MTVWGEFAVRLIIAFFLGTAIGMEKKWRTAIKTIKFSTLLAIGTATYAIAQRLGEAEIPIEKPIAENDFLILGISLICASIIVQRKADYSSIDSAIVLWCSGMVGLLVGSGFFILAYSSTIAILITKYLFSSEDSVEAKKEIAIDKLSPKNPVESPAEEESQEEIEKASTINNRYHCQIICDLENEANVLASMVQSIQEQDVMLTSLQSDNQSAVEVKIDADFMTKHNRAEDKEYSDLPQLELQKIFQKLKSQLGVNSVSWHKVIGDR